jgi:DNA end-binding protein Ku
VVLRQREHVTAVEPAGDPLVLSMMRFAHEIRSPKDLDLPKAGEGWTKKEMDLAHQLIDTLADKWKPEEFRDTYTEVLRKAIEAKIEGKDLELPREERLRPVAKLMKTLEQNLAGVHRCDYSDLVSLRFRTKSPVKSPYGDAS